MKVDIRNRGIVNMGFGFSQSGKNLERGCFDRLTQPAGVEHIGNGAKAALVLFSGDFDIELDRPNATLNPF